MCRLNGTRARDISRCLCVPFGSKLQVEVTKAWTNPSSAARNRRATSGFVSPTIRLRFRFGPHHKSCNDNR